MRRGWVLGGRLLLCLSFPIPEMGVTSPLAPLATSPSCWKREGVPWGVSVCASMCVSMCVRRC